MHDTTWMTAGRWAGRLRISARRCRESLGGACACLLWLAAAWATGARAAPLELPLASWQFEAQGNFTVRVDRRELLQIAHPLAPAGTGDYGRAVRQVVIPEGTPPPYTLQFYVSDNLYGEGHTQTWAIADVRVGHRFKRVLVNGEPVWSRDIAVNTPTTNPQVTLVDITAHVRAGEPFELALQLWQDVDSDREMPDDLIKLGIYAGTTRTYTPLPREQYGTMSYWGDVAIHTGPPPVAADIACQWQPELKRKNVPFPHVDPALREHASLAVECRRLLLTGPWSWPVCQGIPLPMGALQDVRNMALYDANGNAVAAQFAPMNRWPDGTLRWVLAQFALPPVPGREYRLEWGSQVAAPLPAPASPVQAGDGLHMSNGLVHVQWSLDENGVPQDMSIARGDGPVVIDGQQFYMHFKNKELTPRWLEGGWISRSAQSAEMYVTGELVAADGDRYGTCRLRLTLFAGSPLVRLLVTVVNERIDAAPEDEPDHETLERTRGLYGKVRPLTAVVTSYGLRLLMPGAEPRDAGEGWLTADGQGGGVACALRYFQHIWPVGIECREQQQAIDFQLFKPGDERLPTYGTYAGEAKTHEIWLAVGDRAPDAETAANLAERVETPPRLDTSAMIRNSYAWGAVPHIGEDRHAPEYAKIVERYLDQWYANTYQGIRHFGGYSGNNFYWNRLHSIYLLYAMTGERKWYDRAERSIRHYMDVCTLNWWPDGSMLGAKVRNIDKFFAVYLVHQNPHPMFDHWNLTGDPDGWRLGRANADLIAQEKSMRTGTEGNSARQQGWPLMGMIRAWQETGDQHYADWARHIVDVAINHMELRRGAYIQRHGSHSHLGIVPFMTGILCSGLREYHFWTGDDRAGVAVVQNAEAIFAEMHEEARSRTLPNLDYYYSPNPYLRGSNGKTPNAHLSPNIAAAQAYAAWLRDDPQLADIAWRSWQAYMRTGGWTSNSYDYLYDLPAVLYWLEKAPVPDRDAKTQLPRFWRQAVGAPEVWLERPDSEPFTATVRWSVYESPYQRGQSFPDWPEYCRKAGIAGEIQLRGPDDAIMARAPLDFDRSPNGTTVVLRVEGGRSGFHRIVVHGAAEAPVRLILEDLSAHIGRWGVPIDRGWISAIENTYFQVLPGTEELRVQYGLFTPWDNVSLELEDPRGFVVKREGPPETQAPGVTWSIPVPPEARDGLWRFRQLPASSAILRIDGATPLAALTPDAFFPPPAQIPPPLLPDPGDAPPGWAGKAIRIEAGKQLSIARGAPTGEGQYEHIHSQQGTIEFWLRSDTSDDSKDDIAYLRCGQMALTRRTQVGTYLKLAEGFLQAGFLIRPRAWYHIAITWDLGAEKREPVMMMYVNGVSTLGRMQTRLPADTGDWTRDALHFGNNAPMYIAGLRIAAVPRDNELQRGILSPLPDADTLYWQNDQTPAR